MTVTDWVLAGLLIVAIFSGWRLGTINVIAKIGALILAYKAARVFSAPLAAYVMELLPGLSSSQPGEGSEKLDAFLSLFVSTDGLANRVATVVAFIVVFIIVCWLVKKIAYALTGMFGRGLLGQINRALGACCAAVIVAALILICADIIFPSLISLGLPQAVGDFMEDSQLLLPWLRMARAAI